MTTSFLLMAISASSLPLLALIALVLRRNLFTGTWKIFFQSDQRVERSREGISIDEIVRELKGAAPTEWERRS